MKYAFEDFLLDPINRRLTLGGSPLGITARVFDILVVLVEHRGQVVLKETLIELVWGDMAVEEGNLARNVSTLRKVLGEVADDRRFIVTLPGRGYQFVAPVRSIPAPEADRSEEVRSPDDGSEEVQTSSPVLPVLGSVGGSPICRCSIPVGVLALLVAALTTGPLVTHSADRSAPPRVVVLPFDNLGSPDDDQVAAGLTQEITTRIAGIDALRVVSRTSASQYERSGKSARAIGADLGADYLLDGSVHWHREAPDGGRVRIVAQLVRVDDDTHLWVDTFDRGARDVFDIQTEIAIRVARELKSTVLADERAAIDDRPTRNPDAYRAYLKGVFHASRPDLSVETAGRAIDYLQQAVDLDPLFGHAHAALASQHVRFHQFGYDRTPHRLELARGALQRARALAPTLPETYLADSSYSLTAARDPARALAATGEAERLRPNDATLLAATANVWFRTGRWQEAADRLHRAASLESRSPSIHASLAPVLIGLRQYAEAQHAIERSLSLEPDQVQAYIAHVWNTWLWKGDLAASRAILDRFPATDDWRFMDLRFLQALYERRFDAALRVQRPFTGTWMRTSVLARPVALLEAQAWRLGGDVARARAGFDAARRLLQAEVALTPDDGRLRGSLAIALAGLGRQDEASREAELSVKLMPFEHAFDTAVVRIDAALALTMAGKHASALEQLSILLSGPSPFSTEVLKLDPRFDPLRSHPGYGALLASARERP